MTVLNKEVTANYVPAAAVKRRSQALSGITGCKGSAGGRSSWKRFRKYNAYATGITQNVQDCLTNDTAYAMLANSEFVVMLRQTKDIDSVVELYGLSEPQRKYLLLAQPGEGIIKMGNSLIPFNNPQPKDTKTYKLLTTKPGEME